MIYLSNNFLFRSIFIALDHFSFIELSSYSPYLVILLRGTKLTFGRQSSFLDINTFLWKLCQSFSQFQLPT